MRPEERTLHRNFKLLYALDFFTNSAFTLPIYILFGRQFLGLSYFRAGSFFLVSWFVSIAFDFLGGIVADKIGRKQAYICGLTIQAASIAPFLLTKSYPLLLISSLISGVGVALGSNSINALVYEQADKLGARKNYQHANATTQIFLFTGRIYASILGGLAYRFNPRLPYLLEMIAFLLALWAGANIKLNKKTNEATQPNYLGLIKIALKLYGDNFALIKFVVIGGLFALWADMLFAYYQPLFIQQHVPSFTLGVLFSALSVGSAFGAYLMRKLPDKLSAQSIQSIELLGVISTGLLLIVLKLPIAFASPLVLSVIFGFMYPNMRLYINSHSTNSSRAAVLSLATTIFSIGTGIGFIFAFYLADKLSPATIIWIATSGATATLVLNYAITRPAE